ncbi:AMP-binding protein [Roseicyclus persicicus]|uniref:4-coumarate--CoA ligase family protein n=1 Tax=Roseicyclus persicicus TaxID=2650661 RepID=A0A7X6GZ29_9RHOB|nr:AMP-binding protein [Roseibacterium persicicum]NKX44329.1 4-coumarate--CoA ligase family protein [Roseibacterium persicicum]
MTGYPSLYGTVEVAPISITEKLFEGLVGREAEPAIIDGPTGRVLTAGDLIDRIRRLAGGLTERGVLPGGTVAILAPNMPEYPVVFHGVAWGGGTVTTLNPTYTAPEIHHQLNDSGAVMLVTIPAFAEVARAAVEGTGVRDIVVIGGQNCLSLDDVMGVPLLAQAPVDVAEHVVVLPYSSGTTGRPKGVMLTHRNMVANVTQAGAVAGVTEKDVAIAFLPFFHIYGMTVLMNLFLQRRAKLVTMPRFELEMFLRLIQDHRATRLYIVPPVALALAKHPMVEQFDVSSVEEIFSGAAPLGPETEIAVGERFGARSVQGYGMTEMAPISHMTVGGDVRHGSSGRAVPSTECRIVDPVTLQDVPSGQEGELWVRGPQVMKGYLNNPEATATTLTPDGWLRTGDLAIIDADGFMFIRDRLKELIKYKGFQVAPAEVEAALCAHPGVADAAVVGKPDEAAGEVPVAFVVRAPGSEVAEAELQAHVEGCLAHYKHPGEYRFVPSVPKSASGKILRRELRAGL